LRILTKSTFPTCAKDIGEKTQGVVKKKKGKNTLVPLHDGLSYIKKTKSEKNSKREYIYIKAVIRSNVPNISTPASRAVYKKKNLPVRKGRPGRI
jgi:hypothetical protein